VSWIRDVRTSVNQRVDIWAVGCIFAELLTLRPIFKSEEVKMDGRKTPPFQKHQVARIIEVLGAPTRK
jgi:cyclin-dependent kinase 8/11